MSITLAICQMNSIVGDLSGNAQKILSFYSKALSMGADCSIMSECSLCGYPPEDLLLRESFLKNNLLTLKSIAKKTQTPKLIVGFAYKKGGKVYNSAALLGSGRILSVYSKKELPNYGVFDEKRYFSPGTNLGLIKIKGHTLGLSICEDLWIDSPLNICLKQKKSGAELLINISASPYHAGKFKLRSDLLRKKVKQTHLPILYVNMVGGQDELVFDGRSFALDERGKTVMRALSFQEDIKIIHFKTNLGKKSKLQSIGAAVEPLTEGISDIYAALRLGLKDYVEKNHFKSVLIGLSGGIDSALTAAIAVDAIGCDRVYGVTMPSPYTSEETLLDSKLIAENLKIQIHKIPIHPIFDAFLKSLEPLFAGKTPDITEENLQSRIRGTLLMALSNKFGSLLLTTGNKSEVSVGYCTLYGDTAGGFGVLKDVPKTMVYELAEYVNKNASREVIPISTIQRAPTAELKENQKDQDTLPPYDLLDRMIQGYVEEDSGIDRLTRKGFDPSILKRVIRMIDLNEYKRRQSAPGVKITPKSYGKDRRMPITNRYSES